MRTLLALVVLALVLPNVVAQVGGQVSNKPPLLVMFANTAGATPTVGAVDELSGVVRDPNGEEDLVAIRIENRISAAAHHDRTLTAADLNAATEPAAYTGGWKVWNPVPDDGRLSFKFRVEYPKPQVARWGASVRDEGDWQANATTLKVRVPVVGAADASGNLSASLPAPAPSVPMPVTFPPTSGLSLVELEFSAPPAGGLDVTFDFLSGPPPGVPAPPASGTPALFFDARVAAGGAPDVSVQPTRATIQFRLEKAWLASNCVAPCVVNLFHYSSANRWDAFAATAVGEDATHVLFEATVTSFSPFAAGGATPAAPAPAGGGGGGFTPVSTTPAPADPAFTPTLTPTSAGALPVSEGPAQAENADPMDPPGGSDNAGVGERAAQSWILLAAPLAFLLLLGLGLSAQVRGGLARGMHAAALAVRRRAKRQSTARRIPPAAQRQDALEDALTGAQEVSVIQAAREPAAPSAPRPAPTPSTPLPPLEASLPRPMAARSAAAAPQPASPSTPAASDPAPEDAPGRAVRITDLAAEQWRDVEVLSPGRGAPLLEPAEAPTRRPPEPTPFSPQLDEATRRLADAIERSWDNVEIVTPRRLRQASTDRENDAEDKR